MRQLIFYSTLLLILLSCNSDEKIMTLLQSQEKQDMIEGAYLAGETGDKKFVPYLLKDANNPRMSTDLHYKGISVYESKMGALRKIYGKEPPVPITSDVDSTVIKFYTNLSKQSSSE